MQQRQTSRSRRALPRWPAGSRDRAERLDIFVSNAGISKAAAMEEHTIEDFDKLFATNVRSPFFLVKELLPLFREGSSIILVSSLALMLHPGIPDNLALHRFLPMPPQKVRWTRSSSTGRPYSGRAVSASTASLRESSKRTCPISPRRNPAAASPSPCRR